MHVCLACCPIMVVAATALYTGRHGCQRASRLSAPDHKWQQNKSFFRHLLACLVVLPAHTGQSAARSHTALASACGRPRGSSNAGKSARWQRGVAGAGLRPSDGGELCTADARGAARGGRAARPSADARRAGGHALGGRHGARGAAPTRPGRGAVPVRPGRAPCGELPHSGSEEARVPPRVEASAKLSGRVRTAVHDWAERLCWCCCLRSQVSRHFGVREIVTGILRSCSSKVTTHSNIQCFQRCFLPAG